jgi:hypothetical protein
MRRWFLGLAIAFVAAGVSVADEKAEAIVKKGIKAHGGADALNKYKAGKLNVKGNIHVLGMDLDFTGSLTYALPGKYKLHVDTEIMGQKMTISQIVKDDKVKSVVNVAGMELPAGGDPEKDELKLNVAMQEAERLTPLLDKKKFSIKAGDDEDVNGKKAAVIVVTPEAVKKEVKMYFDKTSGLLVKTSHKGLGPNDTGATVEVDEETYHSEFKEVKGVKVATKLEVKHDNKKFMSMTMSDIELLEKLDDKEFAIDD